MRLFNRYLRWVGGSCARQVLAGRAVAPGDRFPLRFLKEDVRRIERRAWEDFNSLVPRAELERFSLLGTRINLTLAVYTVAFYRALLADGIDPGYAKQLMGDVGWKVQERLARPYMRLAGVLGLRGRARMSYLIKRFLRFPFAPSPEGYRLETWESGEGIHTYWYRCPPLEFVRSLDDPDVLEMFSRTWCTFDFPLAALLAEGGHFSRPHCMSLGDDVCDMTWSVKSGGRGG